MTRQGSRLRSTGVICNYLQNGCATRTSLLAVVCRRRRLNEAGTTYAESFGTCPALQPWQLAASGQSPVEGSKAGLLSGLRKESLLARIEYAAPYAHELAEHH